MQIGKQHLFFPEQRNLAGLRFLDLDDQRAGVGFDAV